MTQDNKKDSTLDMTLTLVRDFMEEFTRRNAAPTVTEDGMMIVTITLTNARLQTPREWVTKEVVELGGCVLGFGEGMIKAELPKDKIAQLASSTYVKAVA